MKTIQLLRSSVLLAALASPLMGTRLHAASFITDFNSGLPPGSATFGDAAISPNDGSGSGVGNSGCLQLTTAQTGKNGAFVITNDLDSGNPIVSFTATFKVLIGGSSARWEFGNGFSFNFAPDVPLDVVGIPELGAGSGLTVRFETVKDSAANPAPAIKALTGFTPLTENPVFVDGLRANSFVDALIQLNPDNTLDVIYDGVYVYSKVPANWWPSSGSLFWIGARTGSWVDNHFLDNLHIVTRTTYSPFVNSFGPRGRQVPPGAPLEVVLRDYNTLVDASSIHLMLDGVAVVPAVSRDETAGTTTIQFAPAAALAPKSNHSVTVTFADNAAEPQQQSFSWDFTVAEPLPTDFATVFTDGFESYSVDVLDKNASGANSAANGSGNPWFGPYPDNYTVVSSDSLVVDGTNLNVTPHSGTRMIKKSYPEWTCTIWINLAYRAHEGLPIKGNCRLDWWSFDANDRANTFKDYASLYFYSSAPSHQTADWPNGWDPSTDLFWGNGFGWGLNEFQSLSLGTSAYQQTGGNYDPGKYQVRLEEMAGGGSYGLDGWCNTINRTQGWRHNRIMLGPPHADGTVMVYFFIDNMTTPVYSGLSTIAREGFTLLEIDSLRKLSSEPNSPIPAYYDDVSFALVQPPNLVANPASTEQMTLTWSGEGFTLQSAPDVSGPWTDIAGATSPHTYDTASSSKQFFRLRN